MTSSPTPRIVVMGVSAAGKSTLGLALATSLGIPFIDGDDLHPETSVAKMAAGTALDDTDRMPWLRACGRALEATPGGAVLACSALARRYRDAVAAEAPEAVFVHLDADIDRIAVRASARTGHFMPAALLRSQFDALEPLGPGERGFAVDADHEPDVILTEILERLSTIR